MSLELYATRLYGDGRRGCAKAEGVLVELRACPRLLPILRDMVEVDFTPEVCVHRVREHAQPWRDMTGPEVAAVQTWLQLVASAARAVVDVS